MFFTAPFFIGHDVFIMYLSLTSTDFKPQDFVAIMDR